MGVRHTSKFGKFLALEAKGKYALVSIEPAYEQDRHLPQRRFELFTRKGDKVATMTAQSLPGCCGVCVLHSFSGESGAIKDFIEIGIRAAKRSGYGSVLFTLRMGSNILDLLPVGPDDSRWSFLNGKTGNLITTAFVNLHAQPPKAADNAGE